MSTALPWLQSSAIMDIGRSLLLNARSHELRTRSGAGFERPRYGGAFRMSGGSEESAQLPLALIGQARPGGDQADSERLEALHGGVLDIALLRRLRRGDEQLEIRRIYAELSCAETMGRQLLRVDVLPHGLGMPPQTTGGLGDSQFIIGAESGRRHAQPLGEISSRSESAPASAVTAMTTEHSRVALRDPLDCKGRSTVPTRGGLHHGVLPCKGVYANVGRCARLEAHSVRLARWAVL